MLFLLLIALFLCYVDRVLISIAGIEIQREFGWSDSEKGLVFSSFFIGYLIMQLLGGILANKFGGDRVLLAAVLVWSLATLFTPAATYIGFFVLIAARVVLGLGEGLATPSGFNLIRQRMQSNEVSFSIALMNSASAVGTIFALLTVGLMISLWGWPSVFYLFGTAGIVWCILWFMSETDCPDQSIEISNRPPIPYRAIMFHPAVLPLYFVSITASSISFMLASWLPSYYVDTYEVDLVQAGTYSIAPWVAIAVTTATSGYLADRWIAHGHNRLKVRKTLLTFGLSFAAIGCLAITVVSDVRIAIVTIGLIFGGLGFAIPGYVPVANELFPDHGEVLFGFFAASGSFFSAIAVAVTGILLDVTGSYSSVFVGLAICSAIGVVVFNMFASVTPIAINQK